MFKKISRWLRSKTGKQTLAGILAALVIVAIVGQLVGVWDFRALFGTAGYQSWGQYRCLPSCDDGMTPDENGAIEPQDGKFLRISNAGMASFAGEKIVLWIGVPITQTSFEVGIFDGDSGKDNAGAINKAAGNWDSVTQEAIYTLYADRLKDGTGTTPIGQWMGNSSNPTSGTGWVASAATMPNNNWFNLTVNVGDNAKSPSGNYFYRLEVTQPVVAGGSNSFKVRVRKPSVLSTGKSDLVNASIGLEASVGVLNDIQFLYPQGTTGPSTYNGDWRLYFYLNDEQKTVELWDGDFDRGPTASRTDIYSDTADANTPTGTKPPWASSYAVLERAGVKGSPADNSVNALYRREPSVIYSIIDPAGTPIYTNTNPSGTEEWERFVISLDPNVPADLNAPYLKPGKYMLRIVGLDISNLVFLRTNAEICADGECLCVDCGPACPRTIGYWKNNFNKLFGDGKGNAQETQASLTKALDYLGQYSSLYRRGINVQNPQPLPASAGPMTPGEALMILMRKDVKLKDGTQITYPGGRDQYNSMLARALQQDLAAWLNLTSNKIGGNMYIELSVSGNPIYQGSVIYALRQAEQTVFTYGSNMNAPELERAKDIGDQINNGNLGEDAPEASCQTNPEAYTQKIPPDKQPPKPEKAPKAPNPPKPPHPTPVPPPDPNTCQGVRLNTYGVEVTNNPFYGIKFNYQSGTEIKNSDDDEFKFTLPTDVVNGMTSMQLEAKASTNQGLATLECAFNGSLPCGPVMSDNQLFAFSFMGATDNGNGTMTLTFRVQNFTQYGLSHASFGLPAGATPTPNSGNYQSQVCPGW